MPIFKIPVEWSMAAVVLVNAPTLEEAIKKAEDDGELPENGEYIDSSFQVNHECVNEFNS